uniref:Uncharacterized protein n=1 Tax=Ciona savignyi TaxID=51511 RepID=H2ZL19_CIOSA
MNQKLAVIVLLIALFVFSEASVWSARRRDWSARRRDLSARRRDYGQTVESRRRGYNRRRRHPSNEIYFGTFEEATFNDEDENDE